MSNYYLDQESRARRWLKEAEWERNPFALPQKPLVPLTRAEDEDDLGRYFVATAVQVGWPDRKRTTTQQDVEEETRFQDLLDNCHVVLFAERGEGKTGNRLMVAQDPSLTKVLIVTYDKFSGRPRTLEDHAREIGQLVREAALEHWGEITPALPQNRLNPIQWLVELTKALTTELCQAIFVLIDNVGENLGYNPNIDDIEHAVQHLFDPRLWQIEGLFLKFFVPMDLADKLITYPVFSGKIIYNVLHIRWTETRLRRLIEARIEQVSKAGTTLRSISADRRGQPFDLDGEVCRTALRYSSGPRHLAKLVCELIKSHVQTVRQDDISFRITRQDLDNATREFEKEIAVPKQPTRQQPTDASRPFNPVVVLGAFPIIAFVIVVAIVVIFQGTASLGLVIAALVIIFLIYLAAMLFIGTTGGFTPEQTLRFLRDELKFLGVNLSHLIQTISDRIQHK